MLLRLLFLFAMKIKRWEIVRFLVEEKSKRPSVSKKANNFQA